jgi:Anthrax toxin LF subunit
METSMPLEFKYAEPGNCGVTQKHIHAIHRVCQEKKTFLLMRETELASMRLIDARFATKSMDIHAKSSNWGLMSGFVPCDPAFSKKPAQNPHHDPKNFYRGHGQDKAVQLNLASCFQDLWIKNHFAGTRDITNQVPRDGYRHFVYENHSDVRFAMMPNVQYAMRESFFNAAKHKPISAIKDHKAGIREGDVFWYRPEHMGDKKPLMVWGYENRGKITPVTGDYDMWMVSPHVSSVGDDLIASYKDDHGRSAATNFISDLIKALNLRCRPDLSLPVFNHGAEAQNYSFTQWMGSMVVLFCPGSLRPIIVEAKDVGMVLKDIQLGGFLRIRNPKWKAGTTFEIEDMAALAASRMDFDARFNKDRHDGDYHVRGIPAPEALDDDLKNNQSVLAGLDARRKLNEDAAAVIATAYKKHKAREAIAAEIKVKDEREKRIVSAWQMTTQLQSNVERWHERYGKIKVLRDIWKDSELSGNQLVYLPSDAFPPGSIDEMGKDAEEAYRRAQIAEQTFRRTGFDDAGQPIDGVDCNRALPPTPAPEANV